MKKIVIILSLCFFATANLFAGCMKNEIKQIDAKLKESTISADKKEEVSKLRELVVSNEHSNAEVAFESYEKAMSILN